MVCLLLRFDGALCECIEDLLHTQIMLLCCGRVSVLFVFLFLFLLFFLYLYLFFTLLFIALLSSVARCSFYCSRARTVGVPSASVCVCVCVCHEWARECFVCFCFLFYSFLFYFFMCICI